MELGYFVIPLKQSMLWSTQSMLLFHSNSLCCGPLSLCLYSTQTVYVVVHSVYVVVHSVYVFIPLSLCCGPLSLCCCPLSLLWPTQPLDAVSHSTPQQPTVVLVHSNTFTRWFHSNVPAAEGSVRPIYAVARSMPSML